MKEDDERGWKGMMKEDKRNRMANHEKGWNIMKEGWWKRMKEDNEKLWKNVNKGYEGEWKSMKKDWGSSKRMSDNKRGLKNM